MSGLRFLASYFGPAGPAVSCHQAASNHAIDATRHRWAAEAVLCCAGRSGGRRADCAPATCVGDDDANYDRDFFGDAHVVRSFDDERRYLTVVGLGATGRALAARRGAAPSADGPGTYVHVETGCDDALTCTDTTTTLFRGRSAAHNLALWRDAEGLYALGGLGTATQGLELRGPVAPTPEGLASLGRAPTRARSGVARLVVIGGRGRARSANSTGACRWCASPIGSWPTRGRI